jgi:hypothetical protein
MLNPFTHRKILKKGTPGKATIVSMGALDQDVSSGNVPMTLHVYVEGKTPYETQGQWMVKAKDMVALSGTIPVKVDPEDATKVAIDWDALREGHKGEVDARRDALAAQGPVTDIDAVGGFDAGVLSGGAFVQSMSSAPSFDISGDPELRAKLEQVLGRKLEPGTTEKLAVDDPALQMQIMQIIQEHMAGQAGAGFPGAPAPAEDPTEKLRKLAEMRDAGLITAEDYELKKDEILREL